MLPRGLERPIDGHIGRARHKKFFGREACDDFVAGFSDYNFLLDARGAPTVARRPECFECEHHARLDLVRMLERHEPTDYRLLPDRQTDSVTILQRERRFFIWEAELLRFWPHRSDFSRRAPGTNQRNRGVQIFAAARVGVNHRARRVPDREAAVVTGAVAHV